MTMHVYHSGAWREIVEFHVYHSGAWREIQEGHVYHSGAWRQFYSGAAVVTVTGANISDEQGYPTPAFTDVTVANDGYIYATASTTTTPLSTSTDWVIPRSAAGSDYDVYASYTGDAPTSGSATSTWLSLGTSRNWSLLRSSVGSSANAITIQIRDAATLSVLDSGVYNLTSTMLPI